MLKSKYLKELQNTKTRTLMYLEMLLKVDRPMTQQEIVEKLGIDMQRANAYLATWSRKELDGKPSVLVEGEGNVTIRINPQLDYPALREAIQECYFEESVIL